jgi:hypothetical protein
MAAPPPPVSFSAPLRTSLDMPIRGTKEAPRTFRGKYTEVQQFIDHFELLLNKCRITDDKEKCEQLLNYCSTDVQNVIRTMECYHQKRWLRLKRDILKFFDAERALQKYKPSDVYAYAFKKRSQGCHSLTQWRRYYVKYNAIAGGPLNRRHLGLEDYLAYFWMGIPKQLRQILENRILQSNPHRDDEAQYTMKEINTAAEWYFRRNRYESLMVKAVEFGEDQDEDYSGEDTNGDSSDDSDEASDYEEFRRKKKQRERERKRNKKNKLAGKRKETEGEGERLRFQGNEDEVAGMIRKLNAMKLDDPEYAPIYYKVLVLDQRGMVEKCVKPPFTPQAATQRTQNFSNSPTAAPPDRPQTPASFPNNIPLGKPMQGGGTQPSGCFGCKEEGHRMTECVQVKELVAKDIITYNEDSRRMVMKNGNTIWRKNGESLVQAAQRIAGENAPRVMLGVMDPRGDRCDAVRNFYQETSQRARIEEVYTEESETEEDAQRSSDEEDLSDDEDPAEVYLTAPRKVSESGLQVFPAERSIPSTRAARREVLDGVYPPAREKGKSGGRGELDKPSPLIKDGNQTRPESVGPVQPTKKPFQKEPSSITDDLSKLKSARTEPAITPIEARRVRFEDGDSEMRDTPVKEKSTKNKGGRKADEARPEEEPASRPAARQSELSGTVNKQHVMDRILDAQVPMSLREIMVTSKDLRSEFQDLIKVKNVRAVLLGNAERHPLIANFKLGKDAPKFPALANFDGTRTEGFLIKVEMETNGRKICAIIDTGSQLDVVRAEVAARSIRRAVDMSQVTNMNDANGGRGQLQGWIQDVEFSCGGANTVTDLWVSQQAPFDLLLGRPWQRGNRVSIDERDEGTYLVFKDRVTGRPCYELLAVPYEGVGGVNQYQTFAALRTCRSQPRMEESSMSTELIREMYRERNVAHGIGPMWNAVVRYNERQWATICAAAPPLIKKTTAYLQNSHTSLCFGNPQDTPLWNEETAQEVSQWVSIYKREVYEGADQSHLPVAASAMSVEPFNSSVQERPEEPYEDIQYLSRLSFQHPPIAVADIGASNPSAILNGAVARQWIKYQNREPLQVRPTFAAAPQSEYYGAVELSNGQVVHRSSAQNVFRAFQDPETGLPFTIPCHEFVLSYQIPSDPTKTWPLETPYPSNTRLQHAMERMTPPGVDATADDAAFPVHATWYAPPMLPMEDRMRMPITPLNELEIASAINRTQMNHIGPHAREPSASPPPLPSASVLREAELHADIHARVEATLAKSESEEYFLVNAESVSETPRLGSAEFTDIAVSEASLEEYHTGLCAVCFEPKHELEECPRWAPPASLETTPGIQTTVISTPGDGTPELSAVMDELSALSFWDTAAMDPGLIVNVFLARDRQEALQQALETVLLPVLDEILALPRDEAEGYDQLTDSARRVRQSYEVFRGQLAARSVI